MLNWSVEFARISLGRLSSRQRYLMTSSHGTTKYWAMLVLCICIKQSLLTFHIHITDLTSSTLLRVVMLVSAQNSQEWDTENCLPKKQALYLWNEVAVDLIGPQTVNVQGAEITLYALTCINPVSNLVEIQRILNKSAAHIGMIFENSWLAKVPPPTLRPHFAALNTGFLLSMPPSVHQCVSEVNVWLFLSQTPR
jgi:hypothetical protein